MTEHDVKKKIQSFITNGVVIIVGCGLSSAEGIPGMDDLSKHLLKVMNGKLSGNAKIQWSKIAGKLEKGANIEESVNEIQLENDLNDKISQYISKFIEKYDIDIINNVLLEKRILKFSKFIQCMPNTQDPIIVITTNYDRLLEVACESVGRKIETLFVGSTIEVFNPKESRYNFCRGVRKQQGKYFLDYAPRIKILKPHGSLDWYTINGISMRCSYSLEANPSIITPGSSKYKSGYEEPFDAHREMSNHEIDSAAGYIIIGYGFNDDHLQTHLKRNIMDGKKTLIVAKELSRNANDMISKSPNTITLSAYSKNTNETIFRNIDGAEIKINKNIWDISELTEEVLL